MIRERLVTSDRAARFGRNCSASIASSTLWRVVSRKLGWPLMTRDTVWCETPATRATSRMFAERGRRVDAVDGDDAGSVLRITTETVPDEAGYPPSGSGRDYPFGQWGTVPAGGAQTRAPGQA